MTTHWNPAAILSASESDSSSHSFVVMVLNQPILNVGVFLSVCARAHLIIAVDGGANRIKDLNLEESQLAICQPHTIVGDLDSLLDSTRTFFSDRGVKIHHHHDDYSTDFGKCLAYIHSVRSDISIPTDQGLDVVAFGGLGGRADHAFAQLNDLYRASDNAEVLRQHDGRIFLVTPESVVFALRQGANVIRTPLSDRTFMESIGIVPLGQPAVITTRGLEWDVSDWDTRFGQLVSTSNHIKSDTVEVRTSERVLFTMELASKPPSS